MKKLFWYIICILLWYNFASANTNFLDLLEIKGIDTQALQNAPTVQRWKVTELLNIVDCQDCHRPTQDMVSSLTQSWWNVFRTYPGNNFDDVSYDTSLANTNNYYCIAYVGNKWYMNWFPRSTSPVCSGKFCSDSNITNADVIQTVFNITAKIFYSQYKADRSAISTRLWAQSPGTQQYFWLEDVAIIENGKKQCLSWSCSLDSIDALQTYAKYCTYQPTACGMQEFPFAASWKRPIAEMNILVQQWIFTTDDMQNLNIEDYAKWSFILDILWRVKERAQCIDNNDQDNDWIKDYEDNCYMTFNPRQRDNDSDKIGDVCDDDLDNDSIKNPIWIVDDEWNIVYDSIKTDKSMLSEVLGLAIQQSQIRWWEYAFVSKYVWNLKDFSWDFGDTKTWKWIDVNHTYVTWWMYVVRLTAKDSKGNLIEAVSTVTVSIPIWQTNPSNSWARASLIPSKLVQNISEVSTYSIILEWVNLSEVDYVKISFWDGRTKELRWSSIAKFSDAYTTAWKYLIEWTVYLKNNNKLPLAAYVTVLSNTPTTGSMDNCLFIVNKDQRDDDKNNVWNACDVDERVWISVTPRPITQDRFAFISQYSWSLKNFVWFFGDRTTWSGESTLHTYREDGLYTVRVEATTPKGRIVSATTTVTVWWPRVALVPAKLVQNVWEKVQYILQLNNLQVSDIDYLDIQRWDGRTRQLRWQDIVKFIDTYNTYWGYGIWGTVYLNNNSTLAVAAYVTVIWQPYCIGSVVWNWGNTCDMDKDTIPDICDTDIDGDGVSNPLWLIRFQNSACTYDGTNVNTSTPSISGTNTTYTDNCPFTPNPDQAPCSGLIKDTDGDWILDIYDVCPTIPELFNGIEDTDWCPEYNFIVAFPSTKIQPWSCNVCPCQYAQNDSALAPWDRVKAVLYDNISQKPVAESTWYIVP